MYKLLQLAAALLIESERHCIDKLNSKEAPKQKEQKSKEKLWKLSFLWGDISSSVSHNM